jgi:CheY-like chemotaxis protein
MATVVDDFMTLLGNNRDYVLLALAVLVLAEGAIIVLWARRATRLRHRMEDAVAVAERSAAAARAAAATATEQSQGIYRVAERMRTVEAATQDRAAEPAEPGRSHAPGRTSLTPPAPAVAPAAAVEQAEAPAAAEHVHEYVTPVAQKAAAWVLPEVEASHGDAAGNGVRPDAADAATADPAPTTLGWSRTSVPVEPAADFAVVSNDEALQGFAPPARPAAAHDAASGNGNGRPAMEVVPGWDAMFDSNAPADDAPPSGDVLLVEDDPTIARLYRVLLESRGYSVRHACDGLDGLDLVNQRQPDLVLLDIMMPRMNGIAFLQALRSGHAHDVPVVVLSNFMEQQLVDDAMSLGALEYMVKAQTRPEALVGALPHWLRGERAFTS